MTTKLTLIVALALIVSILFAGRSTQPKLMKAIDANGNAIRLER